MRSEESRRAHLDCLIDAIWGRGRHDTPPPADPYERERQNEVLATAIRAYLQSYLDEADLRGRTTEGIGLCGEAGLE